MDNKELDEILESIKNKDKTVNSRLEQQPLAPPMPKVVEEKPIEPIAPPERKVITPTPPPVEADSEFAQKTVPDPAPLKERMGDAAAKGVKKNAKILGIIILAVVIIAGATVGGVRYSQTAYLRPYQQKYGIKYPKGILESFCDQYGKEQKTVGKIFVPDTDAAQYVTGRVIAGYSNLEKDTSILKKQQFKAIRLTDEFAKLEDIYSTPNGYLNSSQKIEFTSLYQKYTYQVIAVFYTNTDPKDDNDYCFNYRFAGDLTEESFVQYRDRIQHRALYTTEDTLPYTHNYLTLSVDSHIMENYKFVLLCKEVEPQFKLYKQAVPNEKVHYPQNYYDANGERNPYRFASKWYPTVYADEKHTVTKTIE